MIPVSDVIPPRTRPVVTISLLGLNALLFVLFQTVDRLSDLLLHGFVSAQVSLVSAFIAMFVHEAAPPLVATMLYLWIFGGNVEDRLGHGRFLAFYLASGLAAALAHSAMAPDAVTPIFGASGAVSGLLGGYLVLYPNSRVLVLVPLPVLLFEVPAFFLAGIWFVVLLATGLQATLAGIETVPGGAAFWAAVAAFAAGAVLVRPLQRRERARVEWWGA